MKNAQRVAVIALAGFIFVLGCSRPEQKWVIDRSDLVGLSLGAVMVKLGAPRLTRDYTVGTAPADGFNNRSIRGVYPKSDPNNVDVPLKDVIWLDGDYSIHVCFHKPNDTWVALGARQIRKDIRF